MRVDSSKIKKGETYGRWEVIKIITSEPHPYNKRVKRTIICRCSCTNKTEKEVAAYDLAAGNTKSCGCLQRELTSKANTKHGHSQDPLYSAYQNMLIRCYDENHKSYPRYGGRGIRVCKEWRKSHEAFLSWARPLYKRGLQLDRIDNNGHYHPDNCKFSTRKENTRNRNNTSKVIYKGKEVVLAELHDKYAAKGLSYNAVWIRVFKRNMDVETALRKPPVKKTKWVYIT